MSLSFGQVIPVTGPNLGFPGNISRFGDRVVKARPFAPLTSTNNLNFGDPAVLIPTTTGGTWTSVADFIATVANIGKLAKQFAGKPVKGEVTLVIAGGNPKFARTEDDAAEDEQAEVGKIFLP